MSQNELRHRLMIGHSEKLISAEDHELPIEIPFDYDDKKYVIVIKEADDE